MNTINTIIINMRTKFKNANEAYNYFLDKILLDGVDFDNTNCTNLEFNKPRPE